MRQTVAQHLRRVAAIEHPAPTGRRRYYRKLKRDYKRANRG